MGFFQLVQGCFNSSFLICRYLVTKVFQLLFCLEDQAVGLVQRFYLFTLFLIGFFISLGFCSHFFNLLLGQSATCFNPDLLLFTSAFVLGSYVQDTVGVYIKYYLDLGHTTRSRWNTIQVEDTQALILVGHWTLTLQYMYLYTRLVVGGC